MQNARGFFRSSFILKGAFFFIDHILNGEERKNKGASSWYSKRASRG
jgi:hypothetical protein